MNLSFLRIFLLTGLFVPVISPYLHAQASAEVEKLAARTAHHAAATHAQHVLIAPRDGCLLDPTVCAQFEAFLHTDLAKTNTTMRFLGHDDLVAQVKSQGLLALDAYQKEILINLASTIGAETLIDENLMWQGDRYALRSYIYEVATGKVKDILIAKVALPITDGDPLVFRDPESGVALIVPKRRTSGFRVSRNPECVKCRMPDYLPTPSEFPESVELLMTVTEQGEIQQIAVANSSSKRAVEKTMEAVQHWRFKPAVDSAGKPFAARILITVDLSKPMYPRGLPESGDPPKIYRWPPRADQPRPLVPS